MARPYTLTPPSDSVRFLLPGVGAFQSGLGLLELCLKPSAFPPPPPRLLSIANLRPRTRELVSVPLRLDPTCHQDASLRIRPIFGFAPFASLLSLSPRSNVLFFQAAGVAAENINRGLKASEGRRHFSVFRLSCPLVVTV